ncbi:flagellar motor switch protein FliG [Halomonas marinisediminis]|uniref:Flagellar motor switch protein FliG n=1 Tax=Halomonas marinisediminis TaxID=2546095 RepID=A0ABY2D5H0_9GAMM|nr:flagellar motor switch protein FliG [Halomonas marinisediminis]TDB01938.1 flagellar motor switch protein FliG [Halomonas marinisediminis]
MKSQITINRKGDGARRAAMLMLSLPDDGAAEVFKHLSPGEIQRISQMMTQMDHIDALEMKAMLDTFFKESEALGAVNLNADTEHLRNVLGKALGDERASSLLEDIMDSHGPSSGLDALNLMEASAVAELIRDEHPQIIATILVHLERPQAARVLEQFSDELRDDVVLRIATFSGVQPAALQELTEVLNRMLAGQHLKRSKMGGVKTTAEILNLMNASLEEMVIESVRAHSDDLAQDIVDEMFLFENLLDIDDQGIQLLMREVDNNSLVVALKGAPEAVLDKFTRNMSQRAAALLREDIDARGPMRLSQVEAEQKAIVQIARRMLDGGEIMMNTNEETYV